MYRGVLVLFLNFVACAQTMESIIMCLLSPKHFNMPLVYSMLNGACLNYPVARQCSFQPWYPHSSVITAADVTLLDV